MPVNDEMILATFKAKTQKFNVIRSVGNIQELTEHRQNAGDHRLTR